MPEIQNTRRQSKARRKRTGGFAMIALVVLLPLALTVLAVVASVALILKSETTLASACDQTVFYLQDQRAKKLNELLSHNPTARRLQAERKHWQLLLTHAQLIANAPLVIECEVKLAQITVEQLELAATQKAILSATEIESRRISLAGQKAMKRPGDKIDIQLNAGHLMVRPIDPTSMAPEYSPAANFEIVQKIDLTYSSPLFQTFARWLGKIIGDTENIDASIVKKCAATIVDRHVGDFDRKGGDFDRKVSDVDRRIGARPKFQAQMALAQ